MTPVVSVCMITYAHESYIREAIEGVLAQQTDFPFELIVSEDCSGDGTRDIVREYAARYPDIIVVDFPAHNRGMMSNFHHCMSLARGKYIALCEGDDYWTDSRKLAVQVAFLEANSQYAMCYTRCREFEQQTGQFRERVRPSEIYDSLERVFESNPVPTLTVVMRRSALEEYVDDMNPTSYQWLGGDYQIWLWMAIRYQIKGLAQVTGVYRLLGESASHSADLERSIRFNETFCAMRVLYNQKFGLGMDERFIKGVQLVGECKSCLRAGNYTLLIKRLRYWLSQDCLILFNRGLWRVFLSRRVGGLSKSIDF